MCRNPRSCTLATLASPMVSTCCTRPTVTASLSRTSRTTSRHTLLTCTYFYNVCFKMFLECIVSYFAAGLLHGGELFHEVSVVRVCLDTPDVEGAEALLLLHVTQRLEPEERMSKLILSKLS